jgi:oxygen-independent coproporphyrinogen-3 oxidase
LEEILLFKQQYNFEADTVYFGGGTPSLLSAEQINSILELIAPSEDAEITLEANPIQITQDWVKAQSKTRINRLSLGVQSMHNDNLKALGRKHTAESIPDRIKLLRDYGFNNISHDLLYGLPYFTNWSIKQELEQYLALQPEHISTYLLTIEDNAPFKHWKSILPDEAETEKQYNIICETLTDNGFVQYEISNFAKPDKQSRHNLHYWLGDDYIGLGAGASGFINKQRYRKPEDISLWELSVQKQDILFELEDETTAQQKADFIIMQLRLTRGLELKAYGERFGSDFLSDYNETVKKYVATGYLEAENGFVRLASKARFVSNQILQEFV